MSRYIKDDIRYMSHEQRVAEGFMAPAAARKASAAEIERLRYQEIMHRHEARKARAAGDKVAEEAHAADMRFYMARREAAEKAAR